MGNFHSKFSFDGIFDFRNSGIKKLFDISGISTYKMIVPAQGKRSFKLGAVASEIMFDKQITIEQQFNGVV